MEKVAVYSTQFVPFFVKKGTYVMQSEKRDHDTKILRSIYLQKITARAHTSFYDEVMIVCSEIAPKHCQIFE